MFPSARLHISARQNFLYNTKNLLKPLKCTDQVGTVNLCHCRSTAGINCSRFASKRPFKTNMNIVSIQYIYVYRCSYCRCYISCAVRYHQRVSANLHILYSHGTLCMIAFLLKVCFHIYLRQFKISFS